MFVALEKNAYFIELRSGSILVIDTGNLTILNTITPPHINETRDIMFLDNGRTMVVTSITANAIVFFHQNDNASLDYTFVYQQSDCYQQVHGLTAYNDSYFFATSYVNNSVYSYTAIENSTTWIETFFIDATNIKNTGGGTFMTTDEYGRYWFSLYASTVYIYDDLGSLMGNFSFGTGTIIDTLITDN